MPAALRHRRLAAAALVVIAVACAGTACGSKTSANAVRAHRALQQFRSRPDLQPARIVVTTPARSTAPGYLFLAPKKEGAPGGPLIADDSGNAVWFHPVQPRQATDFRVQRYRGEPVLTWWEGTQPTIGVGRGVYRIMDNAYRRIAEVHAGNGLDGDLHEFLITPHDTALITAYQLVHRDLSAFGGPKAGPVYDSVVQELELPSGRVLFEWRSLDHVPLGESMLRLPAKQASAKAPFDYFHVNSVDLDDDGNLLVSARNTHTVYKLDRRTGAILWRLGGRKSDFAMRPGTKFAWQHDVRRRDDGTISLFDNSAIPKVADHSRALVLKVDEQAKVASLVRAYTHPAKLLSPHQGDLQLLPNGDAFVGWGGKPYFTEFDSGGRVVFDAHLTVGDTYRAYRFPWTGQPAKPPAIAARGGDGGRVTVYASWNGATGVDSWEVLAGDDRKHLHHVATASKDGFETAISVETDARYVAVRALDDARKPLATSAPVEPA
jgi:hypothetical protein